MGLQDSNSITREVDRDSAATSINLTRVLPSPSVESSKEDKEEDNEPKKKRFLGFRTLAD